MSAEGLIEVLDLIGIAVFAASGALAAARKSMDIFGFVVIATVTAVGGGSLRDLTLGSLPVFWVENSQVLMVAIATAIIVFFTERHIRSRLNLLRWLDALGMALFASIGAKIALSAGTTGLIAAMMGVVTAVFGGVIRDVICNEIPLILQREVYATAAFIGAVSTVGFISISLETNIAVVLGTLIGFTVRALAIVYGLSLPRPPNRPSN